MVRLTVHEHFVCTSNFGRNIEESRETQASLILLASTNKVWIKQRVFCFTRSPALLHNLRCSFVSRSGFHLMVCRGVCYLCLSETDLVVLKR